MTPPRCRILLVEDEDLIAMQTESMLATLGYQLSASVATLAEGLRQACDGNFDIAMLDINLRGLYSFPIADILIARGIPFFFASGYSAQRIEPRFSRTATLPKPFTIESLQQKLNETLGNSPRVTQVSMRHGKFM